MENLIISPLVFAAWLPLILIIMVWSLIWKGLALWKAAKRGDAIWFIVFLVVNTLGILEILYLYYFSNQIEYPPKNAQKS